MGVIGRAHAGMVFGRRVRALASHVAGLLDPRSRVLDVGCGDGSIAGAVMDLRPDVEVVGIDVLVRPSTHIPVTAFDGGTIPFDDGSFDAVTFVDVLHHTADPMVLLREAARVAPVLVIKDHLADGFLARPTLRSMDWVGNARFGVALPYNYWDSSRWRQAFGDLGLTLDEWWTALGLYPRPLRWAFDRRLHVLCRASGSAPASRSPGSGSG
jgi:SAM-dependent methyltransferase